MGNLFLLSALPLYLFFEACQKRPQLNIPSSSLRDDLQKKKKKKEGLGFEILLQELATEKFPAPFKAG